MSVELNALIRVVAADHPRADMREIARHVAKMTPQERLMDFYTEALVDTIRVLVGLDRRNAFDDGADAAEERAGAGPSKNRSSKVARRRSWWADLLASRVHVGNANWLCIGDCRIEDLNFCIEERRGQIVGFEKQIANFERLVTLMETHDAHKVSDLPAQTSWAS